MEQSGSIYFLRLLSEGSSQIESLWKTLKFRPSPFYCHLVSNRKRVTQMNAHLKSDAAFILLILFPIGSLSQVFQKVTIIQLSWRICGLLRVFCFFRILNFSKTTSLNSEKGSYKITKPKLSVHLIYNKYNATTVSIVTKH